MNCEKCKYCIEVDCSNESNGYDSYCYCKYGLGDSYNDGYCNYPLIFIPIGILISKIKTLFRTIKANKTERGKRNKEFTTLDVIEQLEQQIEKMKCCFNCAHFSGGFMCVFRCEKDDEIRKSVVTKKDVKEAICNNWRLAE